MIAELAFSLATTTCPATRQCVTLTGAVNRGERFSSAFGPGLVLVLEPAEYGWQIIVRDERPDENIARLTPPFHFVPNPRDVEGWHFRNGDNTGPNDGSVNAPQEERDFLFSPEVGRSIDYPVTPEQAKQLERAGQGRLVIKSLQLGNLEPGQKAHIRQMDFSIWLSWPSSWTQRGSEADEPVSERRLAAFWPGRLRLEVRNRTLCVRDLYDLMRWSAECPATQVVQIPNGLYRILYVRATKRYPGRRTVSDVLCRSAVG